jgi:hypothetical protein
VSLTHPHRRTRGLTLAGGVAVASLAIASMPATAAVASATAHHHAAAHRPAAVRNQSAAAAAAAYLVGRLDGPHHNHYTSSFDGQSFPSYGETADAAMSLDAAGVGQRAVGRITSYLRRNVTGYAGTKQFGFSPGAIGKLMLLAEAQHRDVHHFGGVNLVREVRSTEGLRDAKRGEYQQNPVGTPKNQEFVSTTSQALAMLALADAAKGDAQPDRAARKFLIAQQCHNGGFPSQLLSSPKAACRAGVDVDSTGYAVQALLATGNRAAAASGVRFLQRVQHKSGGFGAEGGNANSTAIAVEALLAAHTSLGGAIHWLHGQQVGCVRQAVRRGAVNFQDGYDPAASLLATSQAGTALAHASLAQVDRAGARKATPRISCPAH